MPTIRALLSLLIFSGLIAGGQSLDTITSVALAQVAAVERQAVEDSEKASTPEQRAEAQRIVERAATERDLVAMAPRIWVVGGASAKPGDFGYQAALVLADSPHLATCSGTFLNSQWVLTAGHCVCMIPTNHGLQVFTSSVNLLQGGSLLQIHRIPDGKGGLRDNIVCHPNFDAEIPEHDDIAMIQVDGAPDTIPVVPYTDSATEANMIAAGKVNAIVSGWGRTAPQGAFSTDLKYGQVKVVFACKEHDVTQGMICAGKTKANHCSGDSGGPLLLDYKHTTYQIGIVSWGLGPDCTTADLGVYTRVSAFAECFIAPVIKTGVPGICP